VLSENAIPKSLHGSMGHERHTSYENEHFGRGGAIYQANANTVTFSGATATYYQTYNGTWLPSQMIDGIISTQTNGWAIYRDNGQPDQTLSETALLTLASPVHAGPEIWTITINQDYVGGGAGAHLLGDFSLGYTTDKTPSLSSAFIPFTITAATSLNGSTLTSLGNGQLLDNGLLPITDIYTIIMTSKSHGPITALLLNVINDPNNGLPTGGPGRFYGNFGGPVGQGNFVVSELTADVSRPHGFGVTPLPATLPLFATGLGVLGLLGWFSKRKYAALANCVHRCVHLDFAW
jgi:hypothetical protein